MQMQMSWRDHTISNIADSLIEYEAQCACLGQEINPQDARKYCNERYPFGAREYSPYKIWLEELKLVPKFVALKQPFRTYPDWRNCVNSRGESWNNPKRKAVASEGQLSLF